MSTLNHVAIEPDTKDWTWILDRTCPECGYDAASIQREAIAERTRRRALQWSEVVTGPARIITQRPKEDLWSPLEYACHIADVFDIMHYRIGLLLAHDNPEFPNWDQDQTAIENDYATHDPLDVGKRLADRGNRLADLIAPVHGTQWDRSGRRDNGSRFTVESISRYMLHDVEHHLWDIGEPLT